MCGLQTHSASGSTPVQGNALEIQSAEKLPFVDADMAVGDGIADESPAADLTSISLCTVRGTPLLDYFGRGTEWATF